MMLCLCCYAALYGIKINKIMLFHGQSQRADHHRRRCSFLFHFHFSFDNSSAKRLTYDLVMMMTMTMTMLMRL